MSVLKVPKDSLEGKPQIRPGMYQFRLDGFKPDLSKEKPGKDRSINLNPQMKIINNIEFDGAPIYHNLNIQAGWILKDFCHALGVPMGGPDHDEIPGEFQPGPPSPPKDWKYVGPLMGKTGRVEIVSVPSNKGGTFSAVKKFLCNVPGCQETHTESLV
jgi:hypothetical protein